MNEEVFILISLFISSFLGIVMGYSLFPIFKEKQETNLNELSIINNINLCENKTLSETSYCLRDYIKTFYNYTIRNDTEKLLEDIKINGGDCFDYSQLYKSFLINLGFNAKEIDIFSDDEESGHQFIIAYDKDLFEYCKLDMLNVNCIKFEKNGAL